MRTNENSPSPKFETQTDQQLIQRCLSGEKDAWEAILSRYERLIYFTAIRGGADEQEADEVFQAVCLIWFEKLSTIKSSGSLGAWLVTVTRNELRAVWRKKNRSVTFSDTDLDTFTSLDEPPENLVSQNDDARLLKLALTQLGEPCRKLLWLLYLDPRQPSYQSISQSIRIPANSIGPTRARCLGKIKEILKDYGWK